MKRSHSIPALVTAIGVVVAATACGGDEPDTLTLLTYESFPTEADGPIELALDEFTEQPGIEVEIVISGDTGTMLSKAALTAGNPEADVMWGIDNTFLSRAIDADVFDPYPAAGVDAIPNEFTSLVPNAEATPVDFGDVCVNYDISALADAKIEAPSSLSDLTQPQFAGKLVVENPATSSPGLAFLLATIAQFGETGWEEYWQQLRANDVQVVSGWSDAYYTEYSGSGGDRPLVVSYGSSPPFEVLFAEPPLTEAASGVIETSCYRQVEFAGVLRGTDAPESARALIDFLISERFQREVALNLFVFPVNPAVELEPAFADFATIPDAPTIIDPILIDTNRTEWIERWNAAVLR